MNDPAASRAAPKRRARRQSPAVSIGHGSHVDRVLAAFGVLIALSSLGFAGYMVADVDRPPRIAGLEYLSLFARPSHAIAAADAQVDAPAGEAPPGRIAQSIDPSPTGSIPDKAGAGRSVSIVRAPMAAAAPKAATFPFKLLYVSNGEALLQTDLGILHVRAGDVVPELGHIEAIERSGDHWAMQTQNGARLEWPPREDRTNQR